MTLSIYGLNPSGAQMQVSFEGIKSRSQTSGRVVCTPTAAGDHTISPYAMGRKHLDASLETYTTDWANATYYLDTLVGSSSVVYMQNTDANIITTADGSFSDTWAILTNYEVKRDSDLLATVSMDFTTTTYTDEMELTLPMAPTIPENTAPIDGNFYINGVCIGGLSPEPSYSNTMNAVKTEIPYGIIQAFTNSHSSARIEMDFFSNNYTTTVKYLEQLLDGTDTGAVYLSIPGDKFGIGSIWTGTWGCIESYDVECEYYDGESELATGSLSIVTTDDYSESTYTAPLYPGPAIYPTPELNGRHGMYPSKEQ
jgi:hypothetical protein